MLRLLVRPSVSRGLTQPVAIISTSYSGSVAPLSSASVATQYKQSRTAPEPYSLRSLGHQHKVVTPRLRTAGIYSPALVSTINQLPVKATCYLYLQTPGDT